MNHNNSDEPSKELTIADTSITILGSAHVSKASADKVKELLTSGQFDAVAVELCPTRFKSITNPDAYKSTNLFDIIKSKKTSLFIASLALGAFQQRMAEQLNVEPGSEMKTAIDAANTIDVPVLKIDRDIGTTLKRVYGNVPWWKRFYLLSGLLSSVFSNQKVSEDEIERLKQGDILESTFSEFAQNANDIYIPLVHERDVYMASKISLLITENEFKNLLVVIGAGHLKGMVKVLSEHQKILNVESTENQRKKLRNQSEKLVSDLEIIPPPSKVLKAIPWLIVALIFSGFIIGFSKSGATGWELVLSWVVINGGLSAFGALIAGAHPITIVCSFVAAPLTSLNPMIGAGMVSAMVEVLIRKPKVSDFESLRSNATHLKGWWQNIVLRILLVFIFSTMGSAIGTPLAGYLIFDKIMQ